MSVEPYYERDGIRIFHGDCREVLDALGERFDALVTDPPYGMGDRLQGGSSSRWKKHFGDGPHGWDKETTPKALAKAIDLTEWQIIWGGQFYDLPPARGWSVWNKIIRNWSASECELAWTNLERPNRAFDYSHGQLASEGKHFHPTQKPLPLMIWCVQHLPKACKSVLDPFMGSGTTLLAAKRCGHSGVGIELSEQYCEAAAKRLDGIPKPLFAEAV